MSVVDIEVWEFRDRSQSDGPAGWGTDLSGFSVEALDGSIGKVNKATYEGQGGYLVVDTGPWIFGKTVFLPAGVIDRIDADDRKVYIHRYRDQVKNAPEYDDSLEADEAYRSQLGSYYGSGGSGYLDRS